MDVWQEIESLKREIARLERQLTLQPIAIANNPRPQLGKVVAEGESSGERVYTVRVRTVGTERDEVFAKVKLLTGAPGPQLYDSVMVGIDEEGERYVLPSPGRLILVQDRGSSTGRQVEKDETGTVSVPMGSETLPTVVAEPSSFFHSSTPSRAEGRIYPGMKLFSSDGTSCFYLIFLEGHGVSAYNIDTEIGGETLRIGIDYAGKILSVSVI